MTRNYRAVKIKESATVTPPVTLPEKAGYRVAWYDASGNEVDVTKPMTESYELVAGYVIDAETEFAFSASDFALGGDATLTSDGGSVYVPSQSIGATTAPTHYADFVVNAEVEGIYCLNFKMVTTSASSGVDFMTQNMTASSVTPITHSLWSAVRTCDYMALSGKVADGDIFAVGDSVTDYNSKNIYQYLVKGENRIRVFARGTA